MMLDRFSDLLKRAMGLDAAIIGSSAIARAVEIQASTHNFSDLAAYWEHLTASEGAVQELIETVVIPETWFFRDREAFIALVRLATSDPRANYADGVLRLLSLPCATGEEAYSMAMALLDAGRLSKRFRIDAVDISSRSLDRAKRALYGKNSFRGDDLSFRDRHFTPVTGSYQLNGPVATLVNFAHGNIFDGNFILSQGIYDIIFCRNLLIYFDRAGQNQAISVLRRLLAERGTLFVGPSETNLLIEHDFIPVKHPLAFAFHKKHDASLAKEASVSRPVMRQPVAFQPGIPLSSSARMPDAMQKIAQSIPSVAPKPDIEDLRNIADQGHLAEAATSTERHIRDNGPSSGAFCLLGLIRDAAGNGFDAAQFYRKALYLDPNHKESLLHLALLLKRNGDVDGATVMDARLRRLAAKLGT
jgi:chemotaxis protein methyltransferase WspC